MTISDINNDNSLLSVKGLSVAFKQGKQVVNAVKNISFDVYAGKTLAIVGESGSGKSVTASSIIKLLPYPQAFHPEAKSLGNATAAASSNQIVFEGVNLMNKPDAYLRKIRGNDISMIFQEPMSALNPLHTIGKQLYESISLHKRIGKRAAEDEIINLLTKVGIKNPSMRLTNYPHQLSGGQRQRVMIAMAIANKPKILIADEPTTALDITTQSKILDLLLALQKETNMAIILITHDLSIVPKMADHVCVMKDGEIVERGDAKALFNSPQHAYTKQLIASTPEGSPYDYDKTSKEVLSTQNIKVHFPIKAGFFRKTVDYIKAVDDITLQIKPGQTIGIVGESGSGKTTLALAMLRLIESQGVLRFKQKESSINLQELSSKQLRALRKHLQFVFQDPFASLNPRITIRNIILEGYRVHNKHVSKLDSEQALDAVLQDVDLDLDIKERYPHELSGGQRQRIGIARSLILSPTVMVLDEPTSALDRTVQKQVIELLRNLQKKYHMAYLFISHDLEVVKAMSHDIIVLKEGKVIEQDSAESIFTNPKHDYTKSLIDAIAL